MKGLGFVTVCLAGAISLSCASPEKKANKLFVEAVQQTQLAQEAERDDYVTALKFYEEALQRVETIISRYPSSDIAVKIIQGESRIGLFSATELTKRVVPEVRLKAAAEGNPLGCANFLADTVEGDDQRIAAKSEIAREYALAGQCERAKEIAQSVLPYLKSPYGKSGLVADIAVACPGTANDDLPMQLVETGFSSSEDPSLRLRALVQIGDICIEKGRNEVGRALLEEALRLAESLDDKVGKAGTLAKLGTYYAEAGERSRSVELLAEASELAESIEDASRRSAVMSEITMGHIKTMDYERAMMGVKAIAADQNASSEREFSDYLLRDIAGSFADVGQYDRALEVASGIGDGYERADSYAGVAARASETGQVDMTTQAMSEALKSADSASRSRAPALRQVVRGYARVGMFEAAMKVAESIDDPNQKDQALYTLAQTYAQRGEIDKGLETAQLLLDSYSKASLLSRIAGKCAELGQNNEAVRVFTSALQLGKGIDNSYWRGRALMDMADDCPAVGKCGEILRLAESLSENSGTTFVLIKMARGYREAGIEVDEKTRQELHRILMDMQ
jgi:tetratricopeptide (TPR) repeat protein